MNTHIPELRSTAGQIERMAPGLITRSRLNPRTHFDRVKIDDLVESFRAQGFTPALSHLLVRPIKYRWSDNGSGGVLLEWACDESWLPVADELLVEKGLKGASLDDVAEGVSVLPQYELVCGERRWRASLELGLAEVPVVVQEISDVLALELQLIENIQREGLTPMEEANAFRSMLAFRGADGEPVYTVKSLAAKMGRSEMFVHLRLRLCRLEGSVAGDAVKAGTLPAEQAYLLARVPAGRLRDDLTQRVLNPADGGGPLASRHLERIIRDECMVELRGADFDLTDAGLVPVVLDESSGERLRGGACSDCPHNSKNQEQEGGTKMHMCTNPECFRAKRVAALDGWASSVTKDDCRGLGAAESERIFDGRKLAYNSGFVDLDEVPGDHDLRQGVKNVPTWRKLIRGRGVPLVLAKDGAGKVRELANRDLALAAARENEADRPVTEQVFRALVKGKRESQEDKEERARGEREARERGERVAEAWLGAVAEGAVKSKLPDGFWMLAISALLGAVADLSDLKFVAKRRGVECGKGALAEVLLKYATKLPVAEQVAFAVELLICLYMPGDFEVVMPRWAKVFGVDLKAVRKSVEARMADERRAALEKRVVSTGLEWRSWKAEVEDFEWNTAGVCMNPDVAEVSLSPKAGWEVCIELARLPKGWVFGYMAKEKGFGCGNPCSMKGAKYSNRELAIGAGLMEVKRLLAKNDAAPADLKRMADYLEAVKAGTMKPVVKPQPGTPAAKGKAGIDPALLERARLMREEDPRKFTIAAVQRALRVGYIAARDILDAVIDGSGDPAQKPDEKAAKSQKKPAPVISGKALAALKGVSKRIMDVLIPAGSSGMKSNDLAKAAGVKPGDLAVWVATSGKKLVRRIDAGTLAALPVEKS